MTNSMRGPRILTTALGALMVVQSGLGLLFPQQYRDVQWIRATWFGNDWVTLLVSVPLLVVGILSARRGSVRGVLLWLGLIAYAAYNYAYYLLGAALSVFFPLYVVAMVLAVVTLIQALSRLDVVHLAAGFRTSTPVRIIGGYLGLVGTALASVWMAMWAAYAFAGRPTPVEPEAFKLIAALDLSLIVTGFTFGGFLLWRRSAWGFVIAPIASIQGALYLLVLSVNSSLAIHDGLVKAPGELPMWGTLAVCTAAVASLLLTNADRQPVLSSSPLKVKMIRYLLGSIHE